MSIVMPRMLTMANVTSTILPSIATFAIVETQAPACGVTWEAQASWIITDPNNTDFYIDLRAPDNSLIAGNLDCADGSYQYVGATGDPLFTGFTQQFAGYIQIRRRSNSAVIDTSSTELVSVETGAPC